jgi:DNA-binding NtrC family response regulator
LEGQNFEFDGGADVAQSRRPVVLVVEDDRPIREVLAEALASDHDVVTAADGPTALEAFRQRPVDAVLLDFRLPGMDGLEVLRRMKAIAPGTGVILVTAVDEAPIAVEGMKAGAADYITKPFDLDRLLGAVERVVRRREVVGKIFLVANEIGLLTALHVIVERAGATAVSLSPQAALKGLPGRHPRLVVVECPPGPAAANDLVGRLQSRYHACPFLVMVTDHLTAARLRQSRLLPRAAVLAGPYHVDAILERIAAALTPVADARVAMPRLRPTVVAAVEHVGRHYREKLGTQDVARVVRVATEQLGREFRECLGITAKEFITQFRISAVCRMLIDGDHKLEHIADLTGFQDASHLSRVFTRQLGIRPGEYRRRMEFSPAGDKPPPYVPNRASPGGVPNRAS